MNQLFSLALLLTMVTPQNRNLPAAFYRLPEEVREAATVIVSGTYGRGRTPCMMRPDGTRIWGRESWVHVKKVYRGKVGHKLIRITPVLSKRDYVSDPADSRNEYLILMRPSEEKLKKIRSEEGINFWESLKDEEIIAIVELK